MAAFDRGDRSATVEERPAAPAAAIAAMDGLTVPAVLRLQRTAGNAAVVAALRRSGRVPVAEAAAKLQSPRAGRGPVAGDRHRLPTADELKTIYSSGLLDTTDVEAAIRRALKRMEFEWELRTDADDVMKTIFPGSGKFDEARAASIFGTSTRRVYHSVADAEAKLHPADKTRLEDVSKAAVKEMETAINDKVWPPGRVGSKWEAAKKRYVKGKAALIKAIANSDKSIDADYNRDDPQ